MSKKKEANFKNYFSYIPIITIAVGLILSWAKFQAMAENTKEKVDRLSADIKETAKDSDEKIEELKDKTKEIDKSVSVNKTQADNMQAQLQQVSEKSDKIYEILLDLKNKKK